MDGARRFSTPRPSSLTLVRLCLCILPLSRVCVWTSNGRRGCRSWRALDASDTAVTAGDRWHFNETAQVLWAKSYCLCPGCNGTDPGVCEECVPRSPGCDVLPPEYDCWMDVRTRQSGFPIFDTGVGVPPSAVLPECLLTNPANLCLRVCPRLGPFHETEGEPWFECY